jgi:hypothetical protein
MRTWKLAFRSLLIAVATQAPLSAQVTGTVVDGLGQPVRLAEVQIAAMGDAQNPVCTFSNPSGSFEIDFQGQGTLSVARIGFTDFEAEVTSPDTLTVVLRASPVRLDGISVLAQRETCGASSSPEALNQWETALASVDVPTSDHDGNPLNDRAWGARLIHSERGTVMAQQLVGAQQELLWLSTLGSAGFRLGYRGTDEPPLAFARPRQGGDSGGIGDSWWFADLAAANADLLLSRELANSGRVTASDGSTSICYSGPQGELLVATYEFGREGLPTRVGWHLTSGDSTESIRGINWYDWPADAFTPWPSSSILFEDESDAGYLRGFSPWVVAEGPSGVTAALEAAGF